MFKGYANILKKELKELIRDPKILLGMIIVPMIMFPILGLILGYATQTAQEQAAEATLLVVNNDHGNWSDTFISFLNQVNITTHVISDTTPRQVIERNLLSEYNSTQFLDIPSGFTENMTQFTSGNLNVKATVNVYGVFQGGGVFSNIASAGISQLVEGFNRLVAPNVVRAYQSTIIDSEIHMGIDPSVLGGLLFFQSLALPITIMILLTYAMQIAATSVAMEKEEKTLETLLTVPVDRFSILMGKLSGSIFVAGVGAVAYMLGYTFMLGSLANLAQTGAAGIDLAALGLAPSLIDYLLLGLSLFSTLLLALALAVIMSAFASDVRGAQALIGYIYPVIFIPALAMIYLDVNTLPLALKVLLYAIPFSHPIIASKAVVLGDYSTVIFGIVYVSVFTITIMYIASRLFATERILTAKLKIGRLGFGRAKKQEAE
ncbi:MAG TPA: ABC transporter permease subunit [Candidatus Bathyarchaeia archaeon]